MCANLVFGERGSVQLLLYVAHASGRDFSKHTREPGREVGWANTAYRNGLGTKPEKTGSEAYRLEKQFF